MFELPLAQSDEMALIATFCAIAKDAKPNTPETLDAQTAIRHDLLKIEDRRLHSPNAMPPSEQRAELTPLFHTLVENVVRHLTGTEMQTSVGVETLMSLIPDSHKGVHHALRKVAVNICIIPACSPSGK